MLALPPFCHVMGFVVTLAAPLAAGATVVTATRFDLADDRPLRRHRARRSAAADGRARPRASASCPTLELIVSGGAPLGAALQEAVAARFPHAVVAQGYGMTETAVAISGPDRRRPTPPGSVGQADGRHRGQARRRRAVGPRPAGDGRLPQRRAEPAHDGWLRTGDLARIDADGNLFIVDRIKELIKVNALQVAPAELEALLLTHPLVADAAVTGRPDPRTGEVPVAFVVPRRRSTPTR